jgi:hypothetical protein
MPNIQYYYALFNRHLNLLKIVDRMYPLIGIQMGNKDAGMLSIFYVLHPVFNKMPNCFLKNKINWKIVLSIFLSHILFITKDLLPKSLFLFFKDLSITMKIFVPGNRY